ncbi:MAG: uroporphyrinogen-III C-methyltransferase [Bacteroidia bacterium]|nr:uroporphyrinogen-III C-methyltransferase [Bacteroidia bacterium]
MLKGKVIIAGAGPGDPELITLKALRYIQVADVIIVDRLVSHGLLTDNIKAGAVILHVGKRGRSDESTSQQAINELLVEHALQNKLVLRLKGGDISFFSNILDELKTLIDHNIPYEIIPGVTAGSGAAAYAGIPLTARGYSTSVRFLTCYDPESISSNLWNELAATTDTLVFYMSTGVMATVVSKLLSNNISLDKELVVIEQATTPKQRVHVFKLTEFVGAVKEFGSPSMVIIGRVVGLHASFKWKENSKSSGSYFEPIKNNLISTN